MESVLTWQERIDRARETGKFTEHDYTRAVRFTSCAVDEYTKGEYALGYYSPKTRARLTGLGMSFWHAVSSDDIDWAQAVYNEIHEVPLK